MTNTELIQAIKTEIERHLNSATEHQNANPDMPKYRWYLYEGEKELCTDLLGYIDDSLESEKPMIFDEELNEEIKKEMVKLPFFIRGKDQIDYARHFAQWGAEQMLRKVERWVEKNTCRYIDTQNDEEGYITDVFLENAFVDDLKKATKEIFTKWGAEHLKK